MEFKELLARRYSCRSYDPRPVEREKITACLEAGRSAPSGCNSQRWKFIAVDDDALRAEIALALDGGELGINRFVGGVPVFVVVLRHPPRRLNEAQQKILGKVDHSLVDIGIAAHQICLAAVDEGLGSIMLGWFDAERIAKALAIPPELEVALVLGLGYPAKQEGRSPRRYPPEEIYCWNGYGRQD